MTLIPAISRLREFDGPLTRDLVQRPAEFGLGQVPQRLNPDNVRRSVCGFCSTGCGLSIHLRDGAAVNLTADPEYPVNLGMACPKGWESLTPLAAPDRATVPLLRDSATGQLEPADWDTALQTFVLKFRAVMDQHGPDSVAWIGTGQMPTEELAFLGALAKFGLGFIHGDGNTRQCMATAVSAYKECFGFDAPPYTYQDFEESDVIVLIGSNLCIAHPILWQRVLRNPNKPKIIVIDPRRTETAVAATEHIALKPKGDLPFFYAVACELIAHDWIDRPFLEASTSGFTEFAAFVSEWTPERAAGVCGVDPEVIRGFARTIHEGMAVSFWWTMGVNQSHEGTRTAQAVIALALITGNIGRPGTGANSITGQCNAMGSRLFSNTTNLLGGRDFTSEADRTAVARILGIDAGRIPSRPSMAYDQIMEKIESGEIRALWVVATNTAHSWINSRAAAATLSKLDFLVVQDMYASTETAQLAHMVLPAAGWGEKDGTFINSERRFGVMRTVSRAPGEALSDFRIFRLIAHYAGCHELFHRWTSPEAVFGILRELSAGQPCDITGIGGYDSLDAAGGIQWPAPSSGTESAIAGGTDMNPSRLSTHRRLFEDGRFFTPDGKARFAFSDPREPDEPVDESYPLVLITGRGTSAQWHTGTRTGKSAILRRLHPEELNAEIHPDDAAAAGITAGMWVTVASRRGSARARAVVTSAVPSGSVFLPMHHPAVNVLTFPSFDPRSRQPAFKHCAVRLIPHPSAPP